MWAVLYTKSAFGRSDANGHYVLVYSCGDCFTDGPLAQQNYGAATTGQSRPVGSRSEIPDERLVALMVGAGT
jgi:hypothetical protein